MPESLTIRITQRLPIVVNGGVTRWRIESDSYGKNGSKLAILAVCISEPRDSIKIADGRAAVVTHELSNGLSAKPGTLLHQIFSKLVREGRAEIVRHPLSY